MSLSVIGNISLSCAYYMPHQYTHFLFIDHVNMRARGVQSFSQKATNVIQSWFACNIFKTHSKWYTKVPNSLRNCYSINIV